MEPPRQFKRLGIIAVAIGVIGTVAAIIAGLSGSERFFSAYLVAFLFWSGISLGCLSWLLLQTMAGASWGFGLQRLLAAGARTLPLIALFFLPLLPGLSILYPWAGTTASGEAFLLPRELYLNVPSFLGRAAIYFIVWSALALILTAWSYRSDGGPSQALWQRIVGLSAVGMLLYAFTANFAAYDWLMSLEAPWFSSLFGWLAIARHALGALAFILLALTLIEIPQSLSDLFSEQQVNDMANVLLATLLTWAYLGLMQYLVIWTANIPEEVTWYTKRLMGNWQWIAFALLVLYLALPAVLLLLRSVLRFQRLLQIVAALLLLMHLLHIYWLVMPVFSEEISLHWLDIVLPMALGGWWLALFWHQLQAHPLIPVNHPKLQEREALSGAGEAYETGE